MICCLLFSFRNYHILKLVQCDLAKISLVVVSRANLNLRKRDKGKESEGVLMKVWQSSDSPQGNTYQWHFCCVCL